MECSIPQAFTNKPATSDVKNLQPGQSPPKAMLHVNFDLENDEMHERKKKYLTAKYGQHQMSLIKKRLRVEMWMYDQLQILYDSSVSITLFYVIFYFFSYLLSKYLMELTFQCC